GAEEVLRTLHGHVPLALITIGRREQQMGKMERVGLRSDFFDYVEIVDADKEPAYRRVLEAWGLALDVPHPEVVVVGDRESTDLDPARPLGLRLVLVGERGPRQPVDAWIKTLRELPELLAVWDSQDRIPSRGIPKPL
ncbi:MAG: HAD family hydrolase, partial [Chlamydiia bacterium]